MGVMLLHSVVALYGETLASSNVVGGTMIMVFQIAALSTRIMIKPLTERYTNKQLLLFSLMLSIMAGLGYCTTVSIPVFLVCRALQGFGFGIGLTCATAISTESIPQSRLSEGLGFVASANTLASALGPMLAIEILGVGYTNWNILFMMVLGLAIVVFVMSFFVKSGRKKEAGRSKAASYRGVIVAFVFMFAAFAQSSVVGFLTTYAKSVNLGNISLFFTLNAVFTFTSRFFFVYVQEKLGIRKLTLVSALVLGAAIFSVPFAPSATAVILLAIPYGIAIGFLWPLYNYRIIRTVDKSQYAFGSAMYYCSIDVGYGLGAFFWGYVVQMMGSAMVYMIGAALIVVMLVLDALVYRKWKL